MERIYECYTDIICKAAEAGILTEEMKSFYLAEIENHSDSDHLLESEILDDEVDSSASMEHDGLYPPVLSQEKNAENRNEFEAKHCEVHEPILVKSNVFEILSEPIENCNMTNALQWQEQKNTFSSSDSESDIMSILRNNSDILYDTHINSHLLSRNEPCSKKNKCFDCSIPIYIDIPKKKAIIRPKTCLHHLSDEVRLNRDKSRSEVDTHIDSDVEHYLLQAEKVKHHKFRLNSSNFNDRILNNNERNNTSDSKKMEYNLKVKNNSGNKSEQDIGNDLSISLTKNKTLSQNAALTQKIQNIHEEDVSKVPCENMHQEKAAKLQQCKIFERKQRNRLQKSERVHPASNRILPNLTAVDIDDFSDACKNKPSLRECSFCGAKSRKPSHENETNTNSSDAKRIGDGRYEQCLNVNIICKFYSKTDSAEEESQSTGLETSSDNCSKKENDRKNDRCQETSEKKTSKRKPMCRISKIFSGIRQPNR